MNFYLVKQSQPRFRICLFSALFAAIILVIPISWAVNSDPVPNNIWQDILEKYVGRDGNVNYKALQENRSMFDQYIDAIENISPDSHPQLFEEDSHALAYFINAYNAMVFKGVLDRGPENESVWKGLISGLNFFVRMDIVIGGKTLNLKKLEDDIVRRRFSDPRIHAALNCASISCPRLVRVPFEGKKLNQQLDFAMQAFLNSDQHVLVNPKKQRIGLSKIFDWYESDFLDFEESRGNLSGNLSGNNDSKPIDYINRFRTEDKQIPKSYSVYNLKYNKGINSQ